MAAIINERELQCRVSNQLNGLKMGDMIKWCRNDENYLRLVHYKQQFILRQEDGENEDKVWEMLKKDKAIATFFTSLGVSGKELMRRGCDGDIYASHVFCALVDHILEFSARTAPIKFNNHNNDT